MAIIYCDWVTFCTMWRKTVRHTHAILMYTVYQVTLVDVYIHIDVELYQNVTVGLTTKDDKISNL